MAETTTKKKVPVSKIALYVTIGLVVVVLIYYYVTHRQLAPAGPAMSSTGVTPANPNYEGPPGPPGPPGPAGPAAPPPSHNKTHKGEHNGGN